MWFSFLLPKMLSRFVIKLIVFFWIVSILPISIVILKFWGLFPCFSFFPCFFVWFNFIIQNSILNAIFILDLFMRLNLRFTFFFLVIRTFSLISWKFIVIIVVFFIAVFFSFFNFFTGLILIIIRMRCISVYVRHFYCCVLCHCSSSFLW